MKGVKLLMTKLELLDQEIYDKGISVININTTTVKAASMRNSIDSQKENYAIFFNPKLITTRIEERIIKEHELAHIETGSLYNLNTSTRARQRREYIADKQMIKRMLPIEKFKKALFQGLEVWEIAEEFEVTEEVVNKAFKIYKNMKEL